MGGDSGRPSGGLFSGPTLAAGAAGALMTAIIMFALWLTGMVPIRYAGSTATRARVTALEMEVHDLKNRPAGTLDSKSVDALGQRIGKIEDALAKLPAGESNVSERLAAADNAMKALGVALAALNKRSADNYIVGAGPAGIAEQALAVRHFCLSPQIAEPLTKAGASRVAVAARPDEAALIDLVS